MPRRLLKPVNIEKNFIYCPWTGEFKCEKPYERFLEIIKENDVPNDKIANYLNFELKLDRQKAELLADIYKFQDNVVRNDQEVNLIINLPFCACRCFNCTRVLYEKAKISDIFPYYFDAVNKELLGARKIIQKKCYLVQNILYTGNLLALSCDEMEVVLKNSSYPFADITVEVGSPIFVTEEKLKILKKYNVTRIIFNVLTFNTVSLRSLCRRFEFKELYDAYAKVINFGFLTSFDFVVGLLDEKELQLKRTLNMAIELGATNINLYARKCKYIKTELPLKGEKNLVALRKALALPHSFLKEKGYMPYYLYNSEVADGCFENVGYALNSYQSKIMIDLSREVSTTISCGINVKSLAISNLKKTKESFSNPFDISQYVFGIDDLISKKEKFFNLNSLH